MNLVRYRALISVGIAFGIVAVLVSASLYEGWSRYVDAESVLEEIEPRYARLLGLQKAEAPLKKVVLDAYASLRKWAYPADQDADKAGNDVQQRARHAAEVGGMTIVSSQVLAPRLEGGLKQVPVSLTLEGGLQGLQTTLAAMANDTPALFIDSLSMHSIEKGDPKAPQQVTVIMVVLSLQVQP